MKIGLRIFSNPGWTGGIHYVLNITRMLRLLPEGERPESICFLYPDAAAEAIAREHAALADSIAPFPQASALGLDFVYPATQFAEAPMDVPWAGWIPDWQSLHLQDLFEPGERKRRFMQYRLLAQRPPVTVLSSQMALRDTRSVLGDETTTLRVLPFPAIFELAETNRTQEQVAETIKRYGAPTRYALTCNQFWVHKNHLALFQALEHVREDVFLVMTGELHDKRWPEYSQHIDDLLSNPALADRVRLTGRIPRQDQIDLMLGAELFVQPSLFEGWSTFVEEARALGKPILASDFPVHHEQSPQGTRFFDAKDPAALAAMLDAVFGNESALASSLQPVDREAFPRDCARIFMAIAREARENYRLGENDAVTIAVRGLAQLQADVAAGAHDLTIEDEAKFQASIRQLFAQYPEALVRLCNALAAPDAPPVERGLKVIVAATLRKVSPEVLERFNAAAEAAGGAARHLSRKLAEA